MTCSRGRANETKEKQLSAIIPAAKVAVVLVVVVVVAAADKEPGFLS